MPTRGCRARRATPCTRNGSRTPAAGVRRRCSWRSTRGDLIVDWTGMDALRDKRANYFTTFFEPIRHWRGVRVHYTNEDGDVTAGRYDVESAHELDRTTIPAALAGTLDAPCFYLHSYHYYRVV